MCEKPVITGFTSVFRLIPDTFRRGDLSNNIYGTKISSDLMEAIEWDERIVEMTRTRI